LRPSAQSNLTGDRNFVLNEALLEKNSNWRATVMTKLLPQFKSIMVSYFDLSIQNKPTLKSFYTS
jgi:hypothetical protein